jgi:hypothetical protein
MAEGSRALIVYVSPEVALKLRSADQGAQKNGTESSPSKPVGKCPFASKDWEIQLFASTTEPPLPSYLAIGVDFVQEGGDYGFVQPQDASRTTEFSITGNDTRTGTANVATPGWKLVASAPSVQLPADDTKTIELKIEKNPWIGIRVFYKQADVEVPIEGMTVKLKTPDNKQLEKSGPVARFENLTAGACDVTELVHEKSWMAAG